MVEKLCTHYGQKIISLGDSTYYAFPDVERLSKPEVRSICSRTKALKLNNIIIKPHDLPLYMC